MSSCNNAALTSEPVRHGVFNLDWCCCDELPQVVQSGLCSAFWSTFNLPCSNMPTPMRHLELFCRSESLITEEVRIQPQLYPDWNKWLSAARRPHLRSSLKWLVSVGFYLDVTVSDGDFTAVLPGFVGTSVVFYARYYIYVVYCYCSYCRNYNHVADVNDFSHSDALNCSRYSVNAAEAL